MTKSEQDRYESDMDTRRLSHELEHAIKKINRRHIEERLADFNKKAFLEVAETVACLRRDYLDKVSELSNYHKTGEIDLATIEELTRLREAFEEAVKGFGALRHALGRGYFKLKKKNKE